MPVSWSGNMHKGEARENEVEVWHSSSQTFGTRTGFVQDTFSIGQGIM